MASTTSLQFESGSPSPNGTSGKKQNEEQNKRPSFGNLKDLVTFVIGPKKQEFVVHKSFACHASPVLRAAFNSDFVEGQTQRYILEDTTEGAFRLFSEWIYTQNIYWDGESKGDPSNFALARVWVLAEKLLVAKLQNRAMDLIEDSRKKRGAFLHILPLVYEKTSCGSPLRRIWVHQWAWNVPSYIYKRTDISLPTDFLIDLAAYLRDINVQRTEFSRNMEDFYVKENGEEKA